MADIKKLVHDKLQSDMALLALLPDGKVYFGRSEDAGTYPVVVVSEVDDVAVQYADDKELCRRLRYQVTILSDDGEVREIEKRILEDMLELGFVRSSSIFYMENDNVYGRAIDFLIAATPDSFD